MHRLFSAPLCTFAHELCGHDAEEAYALCCLWSLSRMLLAACCICSGFRVRVDSHRKMLWSGLRVGTVGIGELIKHVASAQNQGGAFGGYQQFGGAATTDAPQQALRGPPPAPGQEGGWVGAGVVAATQQQNQQRAAFGTGLVRLPTTGRSRKLQPRTAGRDCNHAVCNHLQGKGCYEHQYLPSTLLLLQPAHRGPELQLWTG